MLNAASAAGLLVTTQVVAHDKPKPPRSGRGDEGHGFEAELRRLYFASRCALREVKARPEPGC